MNKRQYRKKQIQKLIFQSIAFVLSVLLLMVWLLFQNVTADETNTYSAVGTITNVTIHHRTFRRHGHKRIGRLDIQTDKDIYELSEPNAYVLRDIEEELGGENGEVTFLIKERQPWYIIGDSVKEIVDMRSEKTIYYDLSDYNASQQANRIVAIVVGVVLLLGSAGWIVFSYMCLPTISKKKKKK